MSRHTSELTDAQWAHIAPLLPAPKASPKDGPKPIANRPVFEGILWVLRRGARWKDLPERYPSPSTCWRRLRRWEEQGIWLKAWRTLLGQLDEQGQLDWAETVADGSFAPAKKGGPVSAGPNAERVRRGWGGRRPRASFGKLLGLGVPARSRMEGRAHLRMVGPFSTAGGAISLRSPSTRRFTFSSTKQTTEKCSCIA